MKKCACGSYAVNIERLTGEDCDVCHYKNRLIELEKIVYLFSDIGFINEEVEQRLLQYFGVES